MDITRQAEEGAPSAGSTTPDSERKVKQAYLPPLLSKLGTLRDRTLAGTGTNNDGTSA